MIPELREQVDQLDKLPEHQQLNIARLLQGFVPLILEAERPDYATTASNAAGEMRKPK